MVGVPEIRPEDGSIDMPVGRPLADHVPVVEASTEPEAWRLSATPRVLVWADGVVTVTLSTLKLSVMVPAVPPAPLPPPAPPVP